MNYNYYIKSDLEMFRQALRVAHRRFVSSMSGDFVVSACQLFVTNNKQTNHESAKEAIHKAATEQNANIVILPECWNSPYDHKEFPHYAEDLQSIGSQIHIDHNCLYVRLTHFTQILPQRGNYSVIWQTNIKFILLEGLSLRDTKINCTILR